MHRVALFAAVLRLRVGLRAARTGGGSRRTDPRLVRRALGEYKELGAQLLQFLRVHIPHGSGAMPPQLFSILRPNDIEKMDRIETSQNQGDVGRFSKNTEMSLNVRILTPASMHGISHACCWKRIFQTDMRYLFLEVDGHCTDRGAACCAEACSLHCGRSTTLCHERNTHADIAKRCHLPSRSC